MNRLWIRLTLAFVSLTLLSVMLVAILANNAATVQFREYLMRQEAVNQSDLIDELTTYYQTNGSWADVALVMEGQSQAGQGRGRTRGSSLVLADANGVVVYGTHTGAELSSIEKSAALPVTLDGAEIGYLLVDSPGRGALSQAQQAFLDQLQGNLITAALIAGAVAVVIGLLISRALAMPLASLARAAHAFGRRDWSQRIALRGTQEMAEVAIAMNNMAQSLQRSETLRRDMVADIAHELRTPVSVIQGNLRAMLDEVYPLERSEIATLYDETRLLNRLIDDLRELALAESGQLIINYRTIDPADVVRSTADHFGAAAESQGIQLTVALSPDLPQISADADRLAQVLRNQLVNALRYTSPHGTITLSARREKQQVVFSVEDTGVGISAEDLPHIFDRFYRGDKSRTRTSGGTGLGLAIARTLVEAMGGQIAVESTVNVGSHFWFTLARTSDHN